MHKLVLVVAALWLLSTAGWAGADAAEDGVEKPSISTTQTQVVTAIVEAISHETRAVTLRGPEGEVHSFIAGAEAHNLDQVNVGDTVVATYVQNMTIEVIDGDRTAPDAGALSMRERAGTVTESGMAAVDTVVTSATLVEINMQNNTFKLKGPEGHIKEYQARDEENLKKVNVGDIVIMTYSESVGLSLEKSTLK